MGAVFRGVDLSSNVSAAIKFCLNDEPRFVREIGLLQKLPAHDSIIGFRAAHIRHDSQANSMRCFVMEYAGGGSIADRLKKWKRLPLIESIRICRGVARGLAHLHQHDIRHRDLKPLNVLLNDTHHAKLADFGLAVDVLKGYSHIAGTPLYMAPEIFKDASQADQRADYFSLGVTLHEMLTGSPAFHNFQSLVSSGTLPRGLAFIQTEFGSDVASIVTKLCEKDPDQRLTDPGDLEVLMSDLLQKAAVLQVVVPTDWPHVDSTHGTQLIGLAERAEPLLHEKLTDRLGLFVGKVEVLRQLRCHCEVVDQLKLKLSLLRKQLVDVDTVSDKKRIDLIRAEVEKGMNGFDEACFSASQQPAITQLKLVPLDHTLSLEFGSLLRDLVFETTRIKSDMILNEFDRRSAADIRSEFENLWSRLDQYRLKVDGRLRDCTDQYLTMVEVLERGK